MESSGLHPGMTKERFEDESSQLCDAVKTEWEWAADSERRHAEAVPEETEFVAKPELARCMIEGALKAGALCSWVAG